MLCLAGKRCVFGITYFLIDFAYSARPPSLSPSAHAERGQCAVSVGCGKPRCGLSVNFAAANTASATLQPEKPTIPHLSPKQLQHWSVVTAKRQIWMINCCYACKHAAIFGHLKYVHHRHHWLQT